MQAFWKVHIWEGHWPEEVFHGQFVVGTVNAWEDCVTVLLLSSIQDEVTHQ